MRSDAVAQRSPGSSTGPSYAHAPARRPPAPRPLRITTSPAVFSAAACAGRWELFDPPADDEPRDAAAYRHTAAEALCTGCPCITACAELVAALPAAQRVGVWAGARGGRAPPQQPGTADRTEQHPHQEESMTHPDRPASIRAALDGTYADSEAIEALADLPGRPRSIIAAARRQYAVPGTYPTTEGQQAPATPTDKEPTA